VDTQTGKLLPKNESGEVYINGPHITKGYFGNEKATAETIDGEGWLRTGDIGYYDDDGDIFLVDRAKELIKSQGSHVSIAARRMEIS
jgi:4-coumarate--CoA ligase